MRFLNLKSISSLLKDQRLLAFILALLIPIVALGEARQDNLIVTGTQSVGKTTAPDSSAVLDVASTTKGILPPRMTTTQQNAISSPAEGLLIYDTALHMPSWFNGTSWLDIFNASNLTAGTIPAARVPSNLPSLVGVGTLTAGVWNGTTIAIGNGGTGQTTQTAAFDALSPLTTAGDTLTYASGHNTRTGTVLGDLGKFWSSGGGIVPNGWVTDGFILTNMNAAAITNNKIAVANGGTNLSSGTSGGLLYFSGSGTIASSAAYATSKVLVGLGTGSSPGGLSCSDGQIVKWSGGIPACGADSTGTSSFAYRNATTTDSPTNGSDNIIKLTGSSFPVTLPTAVSVAGQFYVFQHQGTNLTSVYTFNTTSGQTINGPQGATTSGNYALYTNGEVLTIYSDGANWQIWSHYTNTGWISAGTTTISATSAYVFTVTAANATVDATYTNNGQTFTVTTTIAGGTTLTCSGTGTPAASGTLTKASGTGDATISFSSKTTTGVPVKGTTSTDILYWRRIGGDAQFRLEYKQTGGGTAGSGDIVWFQPTNLTVDTTQLTPYTSVGTPWAFTSATGAGYCENGATAAASIQVSYYDSTHFRLPEGATNNGAPIGTNGTCTLTSSSLAIGATWTAPIVGWQP